MIELKKIFGKKRFWVVAIVAFILLIFLFDQNSPLNRYRLKQQIRELEQQKTYYQQRIAEDSALIERLKNNAFLEQYAREHYLMKRQGEELYVIQK